MSILSEKNFRRSMQNFIFSFWNVYGAHDALCEIFSGFLLIDELLL
jgi:hypothetical protein